MIKLKNISKSFRVREQANDSVRDKVMNLFNSNQLITYDALVDINLEIKKGEFFGIIGHNGSGKSTLLNIIMGSIIPNKGGIVETEGKIIRLALGMGFDPGLSARENIYVNASILGLTFKEIGERFDEIISFAELEKFVDTPVKFYSSGMRSRLTFAIAVHAEADIFLMDEFFGGVGDKSFREKSEAIFEESFIKGRTIVHVNHNMHLIKKHCDRVLLLHGGKQIIVGPPNEVIEAYDEIYKEKSSS